MFGVVTSLYIKLFWNGYNMQAHQTLRFIVVIGKEIAFLPDFIFIYLPYLSSIHEKTKCIAIFWMGGPHSLGSCHFRGVWATCLSHKGGGVPLSALSKDTTSELAGLFSTTSHKCRAPSREAVHTIF